MDSKQLVIGLFFVVVFISGCIGYGSTEGSNLIDFVDQVRWGSVSETTQCPIMGSPSNLCLAPLELVFTWRGGYVDHRGFSCCLDCERYAPACQLGLHVVEFSTGNLPLSPRVRIPGHKPQAGMIIWTRAGGIPDNVWCGDGCDDGNSCTTDECIQGTGCVFEPINGGTCQDNPCFEPGVCIEGVCVSGDPINCDDENECTQDFCVPEFGCVNTEENKVISNEVPDDCVYIGCFGGERWEDLPADFEVPPQFSPTDCEIQVCSDGEVLTADNLDEPGCQ
jgi:hypothetical protein